MTFCFMLCIAVEWEVVKSGLVQRTGVKRKVNGLQAAVCSPDVHSGSPLFSSGLIYAHVTPRGSR